MSRSLDMLFFGATGYTGRLVCAYLAKHAPPNFTWGLAGMNDERLRSIREELARANPRLADMPIHVVGMDDVDALAALAKTAKVVCTTVGPFARLGLPLATACAREGTHYCDITGEPQFIRRSIDANHELAKKTGAKVVHCCGFDSIPFDIGVYLLHRHFAERGAQLEQAKSVVLGMKGGFSGGTFASMLELMAEASRDPAVRRIAGNPYGLNPDPSQRGPDKKEELFVRHDADVDRWTAPFVMAAVNTRIVRRSNALLDFAYGKEFRYEEVMATGRGPGGATAAAATAAGMGMFMGLAVTGLGRAFLKKVMPAPGTGPTPDERTAGYFKVRILGQGPGKSGTHVRASAWVEGIGDPGYAETSKMLSESALSLANDPLPAGGGVLTPASSMGNHLASRLREHGMRFEVIADS